MSGRRSRPGTDAGPYGGPGVVVAVCQWVVVAVLVAAEPPPASPVPSEAGDQARKAELLGSDRWRRAMFEFHAWLDSQPVYSAEQVRRIRAELASRIAAMSSFELEYLLEELAAKLRVLDSPAARDARSWLGQYLAVMSTARREDVLRDLPDILDMTAAELEAAVQQVEARRAEVARRHDETLAARREFARFHEQMLGRQVAERARLSASRGDVPTFSPYRGPPVRPAPFAAAYDSPTVVGVGPWGSFLLLPIEAF